MLVAALPNRISTPIARASVQAASERPVRTRKSQNILVLLIYSKPSRDHPPSLTVSSRSNTPYSAPFFRNRWEEQRDPLRVESRLARIRGEAMIRQ